MTSRAVKSVSSPVRNLEEWSARIDHESFVRGVVQEFAGFYKKNPFIKYIDEGQLNHNKYLGAAYLELQSWEWIYGQTPQFTINIEKQFDIGIVKAEISFKHARVAQSTLALWNDGSLTVDDEHLPGLKQLQDLLKKQRYGLVEETAHEELHPRIRIVWEWLLDALQPV